jgi:hypothetical protein
MAKFTIQLFIDIYFEIEPLETLKFLICQFKYFSECDSSSLDDEVYFLYK